jgi:hypothetical protein
VTILHLSLFIEIEIILSYGNKFKIRARLAGDAKFIIKNDQIGCFSKATLSNAELQSEERSQEIISQIDTYIKALKLLFSNFDVQKIRQI